MRHWLAVLGVGLLCAGGWGLVSAGEDVNALVAPYFSARDGGLLGAVVGRAYSGSRTPTGPPVPYGSVAVMLLPFSPELEQKLDRIKAGLKDSLRDYADGAARVVAAREAYERALLAAGAGEMNRGEVSDADGQFRFTGVPAGNWMLLAWRNVEHPIRGRKVQRREAGQFIDNVERTGYVAVSFWRMGVDVRPGQETTATLIDRNGWMIGVREELRLPETQGDAVRRRQGATR